MCVADHIKCSSSYVTVLGFVFGLNHSYSIKSYSQMLMKSF